MDKRVNTIYHTTSANAERNPGSPKFTLCLNIWPVTNNFTPEGQIELWTDRGKSVVLTAKEWAELNDRVTKYLRGVE